MSLSREDSYRTRADTAMSVQRQKSITHISLFMHMTVSGPDTKSTSFTANQVLSALAVSLGSLLVGYSSAWSSPAIASLQEEDSGVAVTDTEASWIGSLMPLAALAGGLVGGPLLESVGRRATIGATAVPFIISAVLVSITHIGTPPPGQEMGTEMGNGKGGGKRQWGWEMEGGGKWKGRS